MGNMTYYEAWQKLYNKLLETPKKRQRHEVRKKLYKLAFLAFEHQYNELVTSPYYQEISLDAQVYVENLPVDKRFMDTFRYSPQTERELTTLIESIQKFLTWLVRMEVVIDNVAGDLDILSRWVTAAFNTDMRIVIYRELVTTYPDPEAAETPWYIRDWMFSLADTMATPDDY